MNYLKSESSPWVTWKRSVKRGSSHPKMNELYTASQSTEPLFCFVLALSLKQINHLIKQFTYACRGLFSSQEPTAFNSLTPWLLLDHFPSKNIQWLWPSLFWPTQWQQDHNSLLYPSGKGAEWWNQLSKYNHQFLSNTVHLQSCWTATHYHSYKTSYRGQGRCKFHRHGLKNDPTLRNEAVSPKSNMKELVPKL